MSAMAEEWIVRVGENEFGPADFETLRDWRDDGRLLPDNPVRRTDAESWITAREIPDLFAPAMPTPRERQSGAAGLRSFSEVVAETCRIYRRGFPKFFFLALLVGIPSLVFQISLAFVDLPSNHAATGASPIASVCAVVALALILAAWPIFLAGIQILSAEIAADRVINLRDLLRRAIAFWPRTAKLGFIVYASFALWTVVPFFAILSLVSANVTALTLLLALVVLAVQVYMTARLFVNFMFWQQSAVLGNHAAIDALLESRELARSRPTAPRLQRPLWRGAIIASVWLLVLLAISAGVELPLLLFRLRGITTVEEATTLMQTLMSSTAPDWITFATYVISSAVHAVLRPLLGIAFVVLYFDAKEGHETASRES